VLTIGVLGLGAVGTRAARRLVTTGHQVVVADVRAPLAAAIARDLSVPAVTPDDLLHCSQVVVVATPAPHHPVAFDLLRRGVHVVSTSDDLIDTESLLAHAAHAKGLGVSLVAGASMSPGLSGLLARQLAGSLDEVDEVHVAAHGTGGPSCARQHHQALAGTALVWHDGQWIRRPGGSGRELCWFPEPIGAYDCYRAELSDPLLLQMAFPNASRIGARLSATRRDRFTARLPMLSPPHSEGGIGGLRVEVRGRRGIGRVTLVAGVAERSAIVSGAVAAAVAGAIARDEMPVGLCTLGAEGLPNAVLLDAVADAGVRLQEYVGSDV
jgi:saccharopine dehydrogenase-like NADP-dependent oxidoreductase